MKFTTRIPFALALLATSLSFQPAHAAPTPAGENKLRIHTSLPKKTGESLFSYTAEWRQDGGQHYHATGMSFLDANKLDESASAARVAKKLATSMKDSMIQLDPNWRGLSFDQPEEQAELVLSNKAGYALTSLVVRDYTNQALAFDLAGKSFNSEGVQLAFDLVLAADVEYLDKFSAQKPKTASQGEIEIRIDEQKPIQIKTDGKTTRELEAEIARQLNLSRLSETSLVTSQANKDTRNIKPFDGSEIQFSNLAAKSVAIDITDPSVGVLVKFKFKDENPGLEAEPRSMLGILGLVGLVAAVYFWRRKIQKPVA
ncbi:hypothetical protein [Methylomonas rapida]|uniref:Uncharacterized protein n=1 Tax=Methylomonas rapida TaxID=2963939 RepID=A0ABY7GKD8_9GAMM|nr:hypothetical protein [Methylomonas rapida]WAR44964.1 hypothetical protein NM686_000195 [Methylomonas rapida]